MLQIKSPRTKKQHGRFAGHWKSDLNNITIRFAGHWKFGLNNITISLD